MKKDFTRDYTTEMFRVYAAAGAPTYERARARIYEHELSKRADSEPLIAVRQAEIAVENQTPFLLDILAVDKTIKLLEQGGKQHIIEAVKAVYFTRPTAQLRKGDITYLVHKFALGFPIDERTVYRWLKEARLLCAAVRGLRISNFNTSEYSGGE